MNRFVLIISIFLAFETVGCSRKPKQISSIDKSLQHASKKVIDDVVTDLLNMHPNLKVGFEILQDLTNVITLPNVVTAAESENQAVSRVSKLIKDQTDYECKFHNHWLIIVPRANNTNYDVPITLRDCKTPSVSGQPVDKFLRMVKGTRIDEPFTLAVNPAFNIYNEPDGPVDSAERIMPCYQLLSDLAEQLSVRCWRVSHTHREPPEQHRKVQLPVKLGFGYVRFYEPGIIRSSKVDRK